MKKKYYDRGIYGLNIGINYLRSDFDICFIVHYTRSL